MFLNTQISRALIIVLSHLMVACTAIPPLKESNQERIDEFTHEKFDRVLHQYVNDQGRVDYTALQKQAAESFPGRTGFRCTTPDYLPMAGPLINEQVFDQDFTAIRKNLARYPRQKVAFHPGLYVNIGHGSRGLTSAPLCAELIAAYICGENFPLAKNHAEALLPSRFFIREMVRNKR